MKMRAYIVLSLTAALFAGPGVCFGHPGHDEHDDSKDNSGVVIVAQQTSGSSGVSGQGALRFRVKYTSDHLPPEAQAVLVKAHGGFAIDRRSGKGETYFALPGAGIIQLSNDLSSAKMVATDPAMKNTNMHNATIWYADGVMPYLAFPANDAGKVFTTSLDGTLISTLDPPSSSHRFGPDAVNAYFGEGGRFVPTDVEYWSGSYYIATGYSKLDYVLTAKIDVGRAFKARWSELAFGGKGGEPGQFGTGHGITVMPSGESITIADRPNARLESFTKDGRYEGMVKVPAGAFPCDVDYTEGYAVVGCLHGPDRDKGAPVYILKDDEVVSTVMPKEDLGLEKFQHIHNAVMHKVGGRLYLIVQAWNPGDFAVLEQVAE